MCRRRVAPSVPQELYTIRRRLCRAGASRASQVLHHLSSCMPRPEDSGGPTSPCPCGEARVACGGVQTLGVRNKRLFEAVPALQGARLPLRPPGYAVYASPILFAVSPRLRHGRKTRYGWVARPYPTGTFTLQEMPSFSWRENAGAQPRLEAGAQRTLEGVGCNAWFGPAQTRPHGCGSLSYGSGSTSGTWARAASYFVRLPRLARSSR